MRIGIDARWIFPEITGIGSYTTQLIDHLAQIDQENDYVLFFDRPDVMKRVMELPAVKEHSRFKAHRLRYSPYSIRNQLLMPHLLKKLDLNVFHSTNYMIPFLAFPRGSPGKVRCVATIHDLIPLLFPELTPRAKKTRFYPLFKRVILEAAARTDIIIVPSRASRDDVIANLNLPEERRSSVVIVQEGVSTVYVPVERKRSKVPTVLYVGRLDPYKNVVTLVKAFAKVLRRVPSACLRVIGPDDPRYPEAREAAHDLNLHASITWNGYVDGSELLRAYQHSDVFVLPSKYEGFGLPILEAMACGTPVICGNASAQPDVAGDAAIMIDPDNPDELAAQIIRVLTDADAARELREKGLARARQFTWLRTARETVEVYQRAHSL